MKVEQKVVASDHAYAAHAAHAAHAPDAHARVSSLIDGELDESSIETTIDDLLASGDLSRFWLDAHRTGDWMRSEEVVAVGDDELLLRRISIRLAGEPSIVAPKNVAGLRSPRFWLRTGLPGASIAAAFVVVAWVATPLARNDDSKKGVAASSVDSGVLVAKVAASRPATGLVAQSPERATIDTERLSPYMAAHRDVAPLSYRGPAARPAALSTPVSNAKLSNATLSDATSSESK